MRILPLALTYLVPFCVYQYGVLNKPIVDIEAITNDAKRTRNGVIKADVHIKNLQDLGETVSSVAKSVNLASRQRADHVSESREKAQMVRDQAVEIRAVMSNYSELATTLENKYQALQRQLETLVNKFQSADERMQHLVTQSQSFNS